MRATHAHATKILSKYIYKLKYELCVLQMICFPFVSFGRFFFTRSLCSFVLFQLAKNSLEFMDGYCVCVAGPVQLPYFCPSFFFFNVFHNFYMILYFRHIGSCLMTGDAWLFCFISQFTCKQIIKQKAKTIANNSHQCKEKKTLSTMRTMYI